MVEPKLASTKKPPVRRATDKDGLSTRGIYLLPNLFTSAALFAGFYAIVQAMNNHFEQSAIAIFIAIISVSLQALKAANANPVKSLRTE